MSANIMWDAAVHESAHAAAALLLGRPIHSIKVFENGSGVFHQSAPASIPTSDYRRCLRAVCEDWRQAGGPKDPQTVEHPCIIRLAGPCATERLLGADAVPRSCESDLFEARTYLSALPLTEEQLAARFAELEETARQIVRSQWLAIRSLAGVIVIAQNGEVFEPQIRKILQTATSLNWT